MRLVEALGGIAAIPHFFLYRLTWNAAKNKYEKSPCYVDGRPLGKDEGGPPATWVDHATAVANLAQLRARDGHNGWTLGWTVTKDCGYWFLDADNVLNEAGEVSEVGRYLLNALPDVFVEWSSSGRGLHWLGRGLVPPHSSRPAVAQAAGLEFYTDERGIAFGLTDEAAGSADIDHTAAISIIAAHWFKPNELLTNAPSGVDPTYCGPYDDAELLRKAMDSGSMDSLLKGKARFADLWTRNVTVLQNTYPSNEPGKEFGESEADQALAFLLAFWTGRDAARIERLMRQSALKRDKWETNEHATYLAGTIAKACSGCSKVYVMPQVSAKAEVPVVLRGADGIKALTEELNSLTLEQLDAEFAPRIKADASFSAIERNNIATMLHQRLEGLGVKLTLASVNKMLKPPKSKEVPEAVEALEFAAQHVYVLQGDVFFHMPTATMLTRTAYQAMYNRFMPQKPGGGREDAAKWSVEEWGMPTVNDAMYHPLKDAVFQHSGCQYVNLYNAGSVPAVEPHTQLGVAAISLFAKHLNLWCGCRPDVYSGLLAWMAFNVQNPGRKVRFAPILKGVPGDGKSILGDVMKAVMGQRNVNAVGPAIVMNTGGFTDWAHGACVIAMEEMMMQGKNRYAMANAIKENITNSTVTINRKGKSQLPILNISNFICFTNHADAIPLEDNDRRWWVMFSPFQNTRAVADAHGFATLDEVDSMFETIFQSLEREPGQWRAWLMGLMVPEWFKPNGHAPMTPEKASMRRSGEDEEHAIARQVIEAGTYRGVRKESLSSACLTAAMRNICMLEGIDVPKGSKVTQMIKDLGYESQGVMRWEGAGHRMWSKPGVSKDRLRSYLDTDVHST